MKELNMLTDIKSNKFEKVTNVKYNPIYARWTKIVLKYHKRYFQHDSMRLTVPKLVSKWCPPNDIGLVNFTLWIEEQLNLNPELWNIPYRVVIEKDAKEVGPDTCSLAALKSYQLKLITKKASEFEIQNESMAISQIENLFR